MEPDHVSDMFYELLLFFLFTMRTNLPKTLDQLIFCKYILVFSKITKYLVNVPKFTKYLVNSYHQKRRKTLRSY